ncbi:MAG: DNA repair protein RadC [bacterium]|nr:DNA repair protein RadC [bacterium]
MLKNKDIGEDGRRREERPETTRPRPVDPWAERRGGGLLTDLEVLALVLGPGRPTAVDVARDLLGRWGSVARLASQHPVALARSRGVGLARARRLSAALELGRRACGPGARRGLAVRRPEDLHPLLRRELRGLDRERFLALYLDTRHRVLAVETVSIGSLNASLVHPREVFQPAVAMAAAALVVAHNHPSGCPCPSADDLDLTARLDGCGELMGIALLDHLVVGDDEIVSIREYGWPSARVA